MRKGGGGLQEGNQNVDCTGELESQRHPTLATSVLERFKIILQWNSSICTLLETISIPLVSNFDVIRSDLEKPKTEERKKDEKSGFFSNFVFSNFHF
jgi:hypothetical protein